MEAFRATEEACQWPQAEWAPCLIPLLLAEAQTATLSLPPPSRANFAEVSRAVLDRMGLAPEDHRRWFRARRLTWEDRPFAWAEWWLQLGQLAGQAKLVDKVVLEQFVEGVPAETARWVRCHRPGSLEVAVTLAEDHLAAKAEEPGGASRPLSKQAPVPAPRRRAPAPAPGEQAPVWIPTNPFSSALPPQGSETTSATPEPQECWKCGQPGHLRRDCPAPL